MSLAQITEKIKNEALQEAEEISAKAKAQADELNARAEEECNAVKADFKARFDVERPEIFRRRTIVANLDIKKMMLQARRDVISDTFAAALKKMVALPKEEYLAFCEKLLDQASAKDGEIRVSSAEKYITADWLNAYNAKKGSKLTLSGEHPEIAGGFVLVQDRAETNCSWDMLLQVMQEKNEEDVVKRLFPAE